MGFEFKEHPAYQYATDVIEGKFPVNIEIHITCEQFLSEYEKQDSEFYFDEPFAELLTNMTRLINMASGIRIGQPVHDSLAPFQWFFIMNALCWKMADDHKKRRYEKSVLLIARKSGKSFLVALIFILLLLLEPQNSEFYSVAPDKELSSIIKKEIGQLIEASPLISKHFKIVRSEIRCLLTGSKFVPLATSENRMDGRKANVFVADEVGALKNSYPIEAMQSSQMNMINRTGILISTAYESMNNPMTEEVDYATKVLHGHIDDKTVFSLLYKPDDNKKWLDDDELLKANPLAIDINENFEYLKTRRQRAIDMPSAKKNFLTKHMNIFVDGDDAEVYVKTDDLRENKLDKIDWRGRDVYLGVDLSMSGDNTGVAMVTYDWDENKFLADAWAFVPTDKVDEKSRIEKLDYRMLKDQEHVYFCGDRIVSYGFIENFILKIEEKYGVNVLGLGYDKYNAISSVNKLQDEGMDCIEVKQHSSILHPATKLLKESIIQGDFGYTDNLIYEINFSNCREVYDTNLNSYVNKKKSNGKIDMVAATINAVVLWKIEIDAGNAYEDRGFYIL